MKNLFEVREQWYEVPASVVCKCDSKEIEKFLLDKDVLTKVNQARNSGNIDVYIKMYRSAKNKIVKQRGNSLLKDELKKDIEILMRAMIVLRYISYTANKNKIDFDVFEECEAIGFLN